QLVHGAPYGAAGIEDIVHQDQMLAIDIERNVGRQNLVMQADAVEVVPVETDIEGARAARQIQVGMQALGQPCSTGVDADQMHGIGRQLADGGLDSATQLGVQRFCVG